MLSSKALWRRHELGEGTVAGLSAGFVRLGARGAAHCSCMEAWSYVGEVVAKGQVSLYGLQNSVEAGGKERGLRR